ncbi:hypothetical protein F5148DRAFT_1375371 [Russula earlei]|uniref:Uncharacterized protein n=1 Tax=Russula earlei TaxID=71964 RepID=A0ACC0UC52_9AGAM|nr:hypothetical protein F5148DRAFT_1375371 [Russula earlei]
MSETSSAKKQKGDTMASAVMGVTAVMNRVVDVFDSTVHSLGLSLPMPEFAPTLAPAPAPAPTLAGDTVPGFLALPEPSPQLHNLYYVAVKQINLEGCKERKIAQLTHEVELVKQLSHPNIIKYMGIMGALYRSEI